MREMKNKDVLIVGIIVIVMILVIFALNVFGVISKLTMSLLFLIPVAIFAGMYLYLKKSGRM